MKNMRSLFFDSFDVRGDKITIHKCVIDSAIKRIKRDKDPFESADRRAGMIDILSDLSSAITRARKIEEENKFLKDLKKQ